MGVGAVAETRRASKSKAVTTVGVAANIFRWFVRLGAAAKQHLFVLCALKRSNHDSHLA